MTEITVPNLQWFGDEPITLEFPDIWDVKKCNMACENQPGLTAEEIRAALERPLGTRSLAELAGEADEVAILIDDMTRPTKSRQYVEPILDILHRQGIPVDNIRFIMATGSHGNVGRTSFVKKLGEEIVAEYPCYNHNPYDMLDFVGTTSFGTPVHVNSEVMACDLRIGIGTVLYHRLVGFSGGGKMILPGVTGIETIAHNHGPLGGYGPGYTPHPSTGYTKSEGNVMLLDIVEAARMAGLSFKVDTVLNLKRNPLEVYAGDFIETQRRAIEGVRRWHSCEAPKDMDIVVANTYMRGNESHIGMWPAYNSVKEDGTIVLIANDKDGMINHWIFGRHGKFTGARLWNSERSPLRRGRRLIVYSPYKMRSYDLKIGLPEQVTWMRSWDEVLEALQAEYGSGSRVAVLPDATSGIPDKIWL